MRGMNAGAPLRRRQVLAGLAGIIGGVAGMGLIPGQGRAAAPAMRIVCVGGAITEIVSALRLGAKIVAVDTTSLFPPRLIADLPKVGYLRMLSTEGLLSTKPDLILLDADAGPADVLDQLHRMGAPMAHFTERPSAKSVADKIIFVGKALGEDVAYAPVTPAQFRSFGFPGADDLGNMFQYKAEFEPSFCAKRDVARTRQLNPQLQSFDAWLAANAKRIPLEQPTTAG